MSEISPFAPATISRPGILRPSFPRLAIGASLAAMSGLVATAFNMACLAPYASLRRPPRVAPDDDDLDGRDPTW